MAKKLVGRGQYTLVELHDGKSIQLHLSSNMPFIQSYSIDKQIFSPNYAEEPLMITPELYFTGSEINQVSLIKNPVWKINDSDPIQYGGVVSPTSPYILTVNKNMVQYNQLHITLTCTVTDPDTGLDIRLSSHLSYSKQTISPQTPTMILEFPNGNLFKNEIYKELTAVCKLMKGTNEISNEITYTWYLMDGKVSKLISDGILISGQNTNTLKVNADYVTKTTSFKCEVKHNNAVYSEFVTFSKQLDPYLLVVENTSDKMKNGEGVIVCEAHLERGKERVDDILAEQWFDFQWFKYNKFTGEKDLTWRNPTTRRIELNKNDIDKLSTFMCEVRYKNEHFTYVLPFKL